MSPPTTLADVVRRQAARQPQAVAMHHAGRALTYGHFEHRSNKVAQLLLGRGIVRGDRVAYLGRNRPEYFEILFGAAKVGAAMVPVNWRLAPREVAHVLADAHPRVLFLDPDLHHLAADAVEGIGGIDAVPLTELDVLIEQVSGVDPAVPVDPDDTMWQIYTSGTTGLPKGVELAHRNLFSMIDGLAEAWRFGEDRVVYIPYPVFHIVGTAWIVITMHVGGSTVLRGQFDAADLISSVSELGVTNTMMVPTVMQMVLDDPAMAGADLSNLRTIVYGAAPMNDALLRRATEGFGCELIHAYGLTECTGTVTGLQWSEHQEGAEHLRSVGRVYDWVDLRIVEPVELRDLPPRTTGEIWVRSPSVMKGYFANPEETRHALTPDGWLRTGDAGWVDEHGYLYLTDRVKDMIISGGENIFPAEIENVLHDHPDVAQAAVIGVPHELWGETVKAIVVPTRLPNDEAALSQRLMQFCRAQLAHYKCPTSVDLVEDLPLNASGKVLRRELREPHWQGHDRRVH